MNIREMQQAIADLQQRVSVLEKARRTDTSPAPKKPGRSIPAGVRPQEG